MLRIETAGVERMAVRIGKMAGQMERAANSALSSIGFRLKQLAREAVNKNTLGWRELSFTTRILKTVSPVAAAMEGFRAKRRAKTAKAWGQIGSLVVYQVDKSQQVMTFGFFEGTFGKKTVKTRSGAKKKVDNVIDKPVVDIARTITEGASIAITEPMRKFLAGLGFYRRRGSSMDVPARPLIGPIRARSKSALPAIFRDKFHERMAKYMAEGRNQ